MAQWNSGIGTYLRDGKTLFEVFNVATKDGEQVSVDNPFPVSLGSSSITIDGTVSISNTSFYVSGIGSTVDVNITNPVSIGNTVDVNVLNEVSVAGIGSTVSVEVNLNNTPVSTSNRFPVDANISGVVVSTPPSGAVDAFGRTRVSNPLTLFDSSHRYNDNNLWEGLLVGTGSTVGFVTAQGLIDISIGTTSGDSVIRETTKTFSYQPGKSLLVMNTFVPATPKENLRQRVGYFGADNGMYFELNGTSPYFVERSLSTGTQTEVAQANWNIDKLDGTGPSGITLDITKAQILWMDIEWLGLGTVRIGFVIDGQFIHCHSFHHANIIQSTYITTASLPLRYEIANTGITTSSSNLKQVCSSVISEGGYELRGLQQAVQTPITAPVDLPSPAGTVYPVISIRLKSSPNRLDAIVILTALSIMGTGNGPEYNWQVRASATTAGGTWVSAGDDSAVEYKIGGTSVTGGRILASGFFASAKQSTTSIDILKEALFKFQLERNGLTGTPYELSLVCATNDAGADVFASLDWEEVSR